MVVGDRWKPRRSVIRFLAVTLASIAVAPGIAEASQRPFARLLDGSAAVVLPGDYRAVLRCDAGGTVRSLAIASPSTTASVFVRGAHWEGSGVINAGGPEQYVVGRRRMGLVSTWFAVDVTSRAGVYATRFTALRGAGCNVVLIGFRIAERG